MILFLLFAADAFAPTAQTAASTTEILVTGERLRESEGALRSCVERRCPTNEDVKATLRVAEQQILIGKYKDARNTLIASLKRNNPQASRYPLPVSDLWRARSKVAEHLGFDDEYYQSTWSIYRALKAGLQPDDIRRLYARMEVAEAVGRRDGHLAAYAAYQSVAHDARAQEQPNIAAEALLRGAINHLPPGSERLTAIRQVAYDANPAVEAASVQAKLALARIAYESNDLPAIAAIKAEFAKMDLSRPLLIYTPSFATIQHEVSSSQDIQLDAPSSNGVSVTKNLPYGTWSTTNRIAGLYDDWIDVAFRVTPDGTVSNLRVVKSKGDLDWSLPLLAAIRQRQYTPGKLNDPSSERLERYTYTAGFDQRTGSRFNVRAPQGRIEYFDLSKQRVFDND